MNISKRLEEMTTSPVRNLIHYEKEAIGEGVKIYNLNIGQPDMNVPYEFFESIKNFNNRKLGYEPSNGRKELITSIVENYKNNGVNLNIDEVFVTNGGSEALQFAFFSTCNEGENILVIEPYYANYNSLAQISGIELISVNSSLVNNFKLPNKKEILSKINLKTKAILISNPSNPTGYVYNEDELELISEIAIEKDLWIISDEVYREFIYDDRNYQSFISLKKVQNRVILIDSISKNYNACGARIGSIASKNKEINKQIIKLCQSRLSVATLEQVGASSLYKIDTEYLKKMKKEYEERRDLMYNGLLSIPGVKCNNPSGAFYIMAKLPVEDTEEFCRWLLTDYRYNKETIMLCSANNFYKSKYIGSDEVRISYTLNKTDLTKSIKILKQSLEEYKNMNKK